MPNKIKQCEKPYLSRTIAVALHELKVFIFFMSAQRVRAINLGSQ
jgi:hypothetical protein